MMGLFCKRALQKRRYSAKETYIFKEPTNRSHINRSLGFSLWILFTPLLDIYIGHVSNRYIYGTPVLDMYRPH